MSDRFQHIHQIWYNNQSKKECWSRFAHLYNPKLTPFFENTPIFNFFESKPDIPKDAWFGILSPRFGAKAKGVFGRGPTPVSLDKKLEECERNGIDFLGFRRGAQGHNVSNGNNWHVKDFGVILQNIIDEAGISYNVLTKHRKNKKNQLTNFMNNYVICRFWIYENYFHEILKPCMEVMMREDVHELLIQKARYSKDRDRERVQRMKEGFGLNYHPLHAFICERFWSIYMGIHRELDFDHF